MAKGSRASLFVALHNGSQIEHYPIVDYPRDDGGSDRLISCSSRGRIVE